VNAATNAVDALQRNGVIAARERELRAERREANWLKQHGEGPPEIPRYDHRMFGQSDVAECEVSLRDTGCAKNMIPSSGFHHISNQYEFLGLNFYSCSIVADTLIVSW